ncbi:hypothetical protein [Microbispora oryzae]|uniref:hypothetical protein n=1 Tax=Microbispora oryzae TaxID=2806554 RepID=UPI0035579A30
MGALLAGGLTGVAAPAEAAARPEGRVIVIGVPGLRWDDLDPARTPNLWSLAAKGGTASLSTRVVPPEGLPVTCPAAGWLTVSAGQRAAAPGTRCGPAPTPVAAPDGSATVPGWAELAALQRSSPFRATLGLLGRTVTAAGGTVAAAGPGAALAAADGFGRIGRYAPDVSGLPDLTPYSLVIAEADDITRAWTGAAASGTPGAADGGGDLAGAARRAAVAAADRTVGQVLARVPAGSTVLVAGLADSGSTAHLHVAVAAGPGGAGLGGAGLGGAGGAREPYRPGSLTAPSTRQEALVTLTDLTATVTHALGLPTPQGVVGRPWENGAAATSGRAAITRLSDADLASQVLRQVREPFFVVLVVAQLLFYALASAVVRRHRRMLTATRVVAVVSAALPVSTFLAQLVPWWSFAHPMPAVLVTILAFAGLITALAFAGPWRGSVLGPPSVVAGVSSLALLLDVMTGSHLQVNAVTGYEPVTGGRFYGFGNMAFATYSTGTLLLLAGVAHAFGRRRRAAVAVCLAYGLLAIVGDGWPGWGADFGGVPPFVVGLAVFLLLLTGRRVSVARLGLIGVGGAVFIALIAVADWLRPDEQRTHLGAFVQQVVDGEGGLVVGRKLSAMIHNLGNGWLTALSLVALAFLFLVLSRPSRWGASALSLAYGRAPELRAGLVAALTTALAGFLLNDSGIAIPAMALTVAVPLTLAASARALELGSPPPTRSGMQSARAGTPAPPAT